MQKFWRLLFYFYDFVVVLIDKANDDLKFVLHYFKNNDNEFKYTELFDMKFAVGSKVGETCYWLIVTYFMNWVPKPENPFGTILGSTK